MYNKKSAAPKATVAESKISFWDLPNLKEAYISTSPKNLKEGFEVGELGIANENKEANIQFAQELADNKHGKYDSFLISHKGKFKFESYFTQY